MTTPRGSTANLKGTKVLPRAGSNTIFVSISEGTPLTTTVASSTLNSTVVSLWLMITLCDWACQVTSAPKDSAINLTGTMVRPSSFKYGSASTGSNNNSPEYISICQSSAKVIRPNRPYNISTKNIIFTGFIPFFITTNTSIKSVSNNNFTRFFSS